MLCFGCLGFSRTLDTCWFDYHRHVLSFWNKDDCVNVLDTRKRVLWYENWFWAVNWTYELINGNINVKCMTRGPKGYARSDTGPLWYARSDTGPIWHARKMIKCLEMNEIDMDIVQIIWRMLCECQTQNKWMIKRKKMYLINVKDTWVILDVLGICDVL
jgi:hypothetical protein